MRHPSSSIKGVLIPIVLWANWKVFTPSSYNPFASLLFLSHRVSGAQDGNNLYQKGFLDLVFMAYYVVVFSFIRQFIILHILRPIARRCGIKSEGKLDRFGEQGYAAVYFGVMGSWGVHIMRDLPTWWYETKYFWIDYPHWQMPGNLKCYYLLQSAYWIQQFLVLVLGLERPRSDFTELCIHHVVTLWLIGWSYLVNLTLIGNAIFVSMDIPDTFLAVSKVLNYLQLTMGVPTFAIFVVVWSYFRHYLNLRIIESVWSEFSLIPDTSKQWKTADGVWMVWWMQYQVLVPIILLQLVNLFWYFLIWRILLRYTDVQCIVRYLTKSYRVLFQSELVDERSEDGDDDDRRDD